jgi:hypothetical protein
MIGVDINDKNQSSNSNSKNTTTHKMKFVPNILGYVSSMASEFHGLNHSRKQIIAKMVRWPVNNIP